MATVNQPVSVATGSRGNVAVKSVDLRPFRVPPPPPDPATTRHTVTSIVVRWYLALLSIVILTPVFLLIFKGQSADDAQKVVVSLSSALTGLAGILGLVVAFYFKDVEKTSTSGGDHVPRTVNKAASRPKSVVRPRTPKASTSGT
jgi:hypothetical protein